MSENPKPIWISVDPTVDDEGARCPHCDHLQVEGAFRALKPGESAQFACIVCGNIIEIAPVVFYATKQVVPEGYEVQEGLSPELEAAFTQTDAIFAALPYVQLEPDAPPYRYNPGGLL